MRQKPKTIKSLVILVIIAGILGALTVMAIEHFGVAGIKLFGVCIALIICGITGTLSMVVGEKPEYKNLGRAGMILSGIVFLMTAVIIVGEVMDSGFLKIALSLFIISIALAHISLLHYFTIRNKYARYARMSATVAISLFSFLMIARVFDSFGGYYDMMLLSAGTYKISMVAFIFDLAATLLVPLCNRLDVPEEMEMHFEEPAPDDSHEPKDPAV